MAKGEGTRNDEQSVDLDQYAKDAIDEVFSKEQQSYDKFVEGFMFLTKGKELLIAWPSFSWHQLTQVTTLVKVVWKKQKRVIDCYL